MIIFCQRVSDGVAADANVIDSKFDSRGDSEDSGDDFDDSEDSENSECAPGATLGVSSTPGRSDSGGRNRRAFRGIRAPDVRRTSFE